MSAELRVMSFNIRYGTADDGEDGWLHRRERVAHVIRTFGPDLLGTQEGLDFQIRDLRERLAEYDCVGAGRDDGHHREETEVDGSQQAGEDGGGPDLEQQFRALAGDRGHTASYRTPGQIAEEVVGSEVLVLRLLLVAGTVRLLGRHVSGVHARSRKTNQAI